MRKLPTLETLRVTSPCKVSWDRMTGDARIRHCGVCDQQVYNISEMTRAEADQLIAAKQARMCMRYYHRADGTILLRDGAVEYRPTPLIAAGAVALALAGAALWAGRPHEHVDAAVHPAAVHAAAVQVIPAPPVPAAVDEPMYVTGGPPPVDHQRE